MPQPWEMTPEQLATAAQPPPPASAAPVDIPRTAGGLYHYADAQGNEVFSKTPPPPGAKPYDTTEAPTTLERVGHGAARTFQGLHQAWDEVKAVASGPDLTSQITGKTRAEQELHDLTARLNDEEANYQKGRGPDAGTDWASMGGSALAAAPLLLIPGGQSAAGIAVNGAITGGIDAAAQPTQTGSLKDRAINTALGTATGAVLAPAVSAVTSKAGSLVNGLVGRAKGLVSDSSEGAVLSAVPEIKELQQVAKAAAAAPQAAGSGARQSADVQLKLDTLVKEGRDQLKKTGTLDAEALGRKANLIANGLTPLKGAVTRDPGDWTLEQNLAKMVGGPNEETAAIAEPIVRTMKGNDQALNQRLAEQLTGSGMPSGTQEARGMVAMQSIDNLARASQKDVSEVYSAVKEARGADLASDGRNVAQVLADLADSPKADPMVDAAMRRLKKMGMLDAEGKLTNETMTVSQAEALRQHMNAQGNGFGKAQIINAIDQDVLGGLGEDVFKGARAAAKERFDMLKNPAVQKALDNFGELTQGKAAQNFVKTQLVSAPEQDVRSLIATVGKMPAEDQARTLAAMRSGVLQHIYDAAKVGDAKISGDRLDKAVKQVGESKLQAILGDEAYAKLQSLRRAALDATKEPDYAAPNRSNTATTLLGMIRGIKGTVGYDLPFGLNETGQEVLKRRALQADVAQSLAARSRAPGAAPVVSEQMRKRIAAGLGRAAAIPAAGMAAQATQTGAQQPQQ